MLLLLPLSDSASELAAPASPLSLIVSMKDGGL
jgi:hypothetical protein